MLVSGRVVVFSLPWLFDNHGFPTPERKSTESTDEVCRIFSPSTSVNFGAFLETKIRVNICLLGGLAPVCLVSSDRIPPPFFLRHKFRPFGRGPTTPGIGELNDHHGY